MNLYVSIHMYIRENTYRIIHTQITYFQSRLGIYRSTLHRYIVITIQCILCVYNVVILLYCYYYYEYYSITVPFYYCAICLEYISIGLFRFLV